MEQLKFEPELELDDLEVASLALMTSQQGYRVFHKIIQHQFSEFVSAHINTATGNDHQIVEGHRVIKTAAQFYDGITNKVNRIVESYTADRKVEPKPVDITEGIVDLGPQASTQDDFLIDSEEGL